MSKNLFLVFFSALSFLTFHFKAQVTYSQQDSLAGFSESGFITQQVSNGITGDMLKYNLNIAKKEFIYEKYYHNHNVERLWKTAKTTSVNPGCTNMGFEDATPFFGWTLSSGIISNCVTLAGCCPNPGAAASAVISSGAGVSDPVVPSLKILSPFPGNRVARVNNSATGAVVNRIEQSFLVNSGNAIFQIASASVLNSDPTTNHCCVDQPGLVINVQDSAGNTLTCPYLAFNAPSQCCPIDPSDTTWHAYNSGFVQGFYRGWKTQTIDLSPYIGSFITVQITVMDCAQSGHYGYSYIDCQCLPLEISLNGSIYDATPQTPINVSTCGATSALIFAPTGLDPYTWNGPAASGITGITTQSISTTTPGTYTLNMNPSGGCTAGGVTKYVILNVTPNPTVTNVTAQATCTNATGSGTVNVTSGTAPFSYSWTPAASTSSVGTGLSPGTDYTVNVVDTFGCQHATVISIASFTDAPSYTITPLSANLTCLNPSVSVSASTFSTTIAVWTHTTTSGFDVNAPGTYSCIVTNTVSSCTATVPISISTNTVAPTAAYSMLCNGSLVSLNASSTAGIALGWLAPTSPPSPVSNPGTSTATGIFTLTATNLSTGCQTTYTVESLVPLLNITTTPSNQLTCVSPTIQSMASSTTPSATVTWFDGVTTSTAGALSITAPGSYTATSSLAGGCSTQSVITVTTNTAVGVNISSPSTIISCATNSLGLTATGTTGTAYNFIWMPSSPTYTNSTIVVSNAGTYTVIALNTVNGCTASATESVTHETLRASFVADPYQGLMPLPVSFTNTSTNALSYHWDLGNGNTYITTDASTVYDFQGDYAVILTATNGFCVDTAMRIIKVDLVSSFKVPNVFTPNGDGKNDSFTMIAVNMGEINISIFDRWGLKVFETTANGNIKWDGKTKSGAPVNDGTYFYIIKAKGLDDVPYDVQGTVNIFK